jgi:hypothetical protein
MRSLMVALFAFVLGFALVAPLVAQAPRSMEKTPPARLDPIPVAPVVPVVPATSCAGTVTVRYTVTGCSGATGCAGVSATGCSGSGRHLFQRLRDRRAARASCGG